MPLVGRESTIDATAAFLDDLPRRSSVLVLEGGAGLGKTLVWLEALESARLREHLVLQARPSESEARLGFSALSDVLGASFAEVRADLPAPQERALATALLLAEAEEPAELRTVATGFVNVLASLSRSGPVVVAVDDVQWLDASSARVLAFAARRLPTGVGLLLTLRTGPGSEPPALVRDLPADLALRIVLEPLSLGALHHVIEGRLGISLPRPTLARLAAASGGNPLFALEIGRVLAAHGDGGALAGPLPVPATLQELVAARVEALSEPARSACLVAAAMSRPTPRVVERALEAESDVATALAEAEDAGVIVVERGRIRFTHPLLASAIYGTASTLRRGRVHGRLAEVIDDLEERARHRAMGADGPDEAAADELERAARRAALRGAQDAAADLLDGACRLTPPHSVDVLARRRLLWAASLPAVGDFRLARTVAEQALAGTADRRLRGEALSLLATLAWHDGDARAATALAEEGLGAVEGEPSLEGAARVLLVRFNFSVDLDQAVTHAESALEVLDEDREPGLVAHVLIDLFFGSALAGRNAPRELLDRALALEARVPAARGVAPQPMPLLWFHCTDDLVAARERFEQDVRWYRERGDDVAVADRMSHLAVAELRAGSCETAERLVEESCASLDGLDVRGPRAMAFEKRSLVDAHRGRTERARSTLEPLVEGYERSGQVWWAALALSTLAFAHFVDERHREVDDALRRMHEHASAVGARDVLFDRSEPFHVESLLELGELDAAREALDRLERRGRTLPRAWIAASLPRARALVRAAEGDVPAALAMLERAQAVPALPFERAWTLLVHGRLLRRAKQKRTAADVLRRAAESFEELGAPAFAARARADLQRVGLRRASADLTPSELRIAQLAAEGRTNREVAQAAFVSQKTVEANLARVYRKLGIRSRAELGARMAVARDGAPET